MAYYNLISKAPALFVYKNGVTGISCQGQTASKSSKQAYTLNI